VQFTTKNLEACTNSSDNRRLTYTDPAMPGLQLELLRKTKKFRFRYLWHGKQRSVVIGEFPSFSINDARAKGNRSKTAGNMARYAFVALCLLFAQTWQRWRTIWARCGTGWAPLMFNLSPR